MRRYSPSPASIPSSPIAAIFWGETNVDGGYFTRNDLFAFDAIGYDWDDQFKPNITAQPTDLVLRQDSVGSISVSAFTNHPLGLEYMWWRHHISGNIPVDTGPTLTLDTSVVGDYSYFVEVKDLIPGGLRTRSETVSVTVLPTPLITNDIDDIAVNENFPATFSFETNTDSTIINTFWTIDGTEIPTAGPAMSVQIVGTPSNNGGLVNVVITTTCETLNSRTATLLVNLLQCSPADLNGDGDLNFFDVSAFLSAFGNSDPVADFNGDGEFNFFDVSAFLNAFGDGCP